MFHEVYCVAQSKDQATDFVAHLRAMGVPADKVSVVVECSEVEHLAHPDSKHFHDMKNGAIGGAIIGFAYGAATLAVIGPAGIPGVFGAALLLGFSTFGGVLLGGIIGSTGILARPVMRPSIEHQYEAEVSSGRILISVVAHSVKERDEFMEFMNYWGASDIHYSGEATA